MTEELERTLAELNRVQDEAAARRLALEYIVVRTAAYVEARHPGAMEFKISSRAPDEDREYMEKVNAHLSDLQGKIRAEAARQ